MSLLTIGLLSAGSIFGGSLLGMGLARVLVGGGVPITLDRVFAVRPALLLQGKVATIGDTHAVRDHAPTLSRLKHRFAT